MAQVLARNNNPVVNCLPTTLRSAGYPTYDAFLQDPTAYAQFSDAVSVDSTVADFGSGAALPDVVTCTVLLKVLVSGEAHSLQSRPREDETRFQAALHTARP